MALRDRLRRSTARRLESGDEPQQVFLAAIGPSPWVLFFLSPFIVLFLWRPVIVAVTDRSVVVFRGGRLRNSRPRKTLVRLPRRTRIGPTRGLLWGRINIAGQRLWVHRRFFNDVFAADAGLVAAPPIGAGAAWRRRDDLVPAVGPPAGVAVEHDPGHGLASPRAHASSWTPPGAWPAVEATTGRWPLTRTRSAVWTWLLILAMVGGGVLVYRGVEIRRDETVARQGLQDYVAAPVAPDARRRFESREGYFRVDFPGSPKRDSRIQQTPVGPLATIRFLQTVGRDAIFLVAVVQLPAVPPDPTDLFMAGVESEAEVLKGRVLSSGETTFQGRPAVEALIESHVKAGTTDVHYAKVLIFMYGRQVYVLEVAGKENPPLGWDRFVESFQIVLPFTKLP